MVELICGRFISIIYKLRKYIEHGGGLLCFDNRFGFLFILENAMQILVRLCVQNLPPASRCQRVYTVYFFLTMNVIILFLI